MLTNLSCYYKWKSFSTYQIVPRSCRFCRLLNNRPALAFFNCSKGPMYGRHGAKRITLVENQLSSVFLTDTVSWCREPSVQCIYQNILLKKTLFPLWKCTLEITHFCPQGRGRGQSDVIIYILTRRGEDRRALQCHNNVLSDVLTPSLPLRCTATGMTGPKPNVQYPVLNSKHHSKYTKLVAWMFWEYQECLQ